MKFTFLSILMTISFPLFAQQVEKIDIPRGVVYKYCDSLTYEKAKSLVIEELSNSPKYSLSSAILFVGPVLWDRYKQVNSLKKIKGGNVTILGYNKDAPSAKMTQSEKDFKLVWDHLREEINTSKDFKLRKATPSELKYYWSVISFDIEEPLIIIETKDHNYILNISPKSLKLLWLDEAPQQ